MKTSLVIDDRVFQDARKEAAAAGKTISEVISDWARLGRVEWLRRKREPSSDFKAMNLGEAKVDLSSRRHWMEELEDDRT